jgi:hypothetical protein
MGAYKIATWAILLLGVGHASFTFKKFKTIKEDSLWFFSTSLGLVFNGMLNHINLTIPNDLVSNLTIGANCVQFIFCAILVYHVRKPTTYIALIVSAAILILSAIHKL